ncbi:ATP-dependent DNA ligase [Paenibacillus glucanolyticus]|jgi:DNA ligase-1|nr:hypothetical protein BK142_31595 [Paenibacillus glucanolyticus]
MLLEKTPSPLTSSKYLAEPKIDGVRGLLIGDTNYSRLWSRHQTDMTNQFPEICKKINKGRSIILDGEVASFNPDLSDFDFDSVMDRFRLRNEFKIKIAAERSPTTFIAWDILYYNGQDLRGLPLYKRKEILNEVLIDDGVISKVASLSGLHGENLAKQVVERGWEGCVYKEVESSYQTGKRSKQWLKWLNYKEQEVYVTGIRKKKFGYMLSRFEQGEYKPAGILELGTSQQIRSKVWNIARTNINKEDSSYYYLLPTPVLRIKVKYVRLTRNGFMRTPSFLSF